jgi:hypothetical protein
VRRTVPGKVSLGGEGQGSRFGKVERELRWFAVAERGIGRRREFPVSDAANTLRRACQTGFGRLPGAKPALFRLMVCSSRHCNRPMVVGSTA